MDKHTKTMEQTTDVALRQHIVKLLNGGDAHVEFEGAVKDFPARLRGKLPDGAEHTPWQLLEHLRIAQWDILEFSRNPNHRSPEFPDGYWPESPEPPSDQAWEQSVKAFLRDRKAMCDLVADESVDLYARIPHGDGQTVLREALVAADHNAYHLGQIVLLRRLLGTWD
jgi:hypothetical protein